MEGPQTALTFQRQTRLICARKYEVTMVAWHLHSHRGRETTKYSPQECPCVKERLNVIFSKVIRGVEYLDMEQPPHEGSTEYQE